MASDVLVEFFAILKNSDNGAVEIDRLDHEFYDSNCLTLLYAYNYTYIMSIIKWSNRIQQEPSKRWIRTIQHSLRAEFDDALVAVESRIYTDATYHQVGTTTTG